MGILDSGLETTDYGQQGWNAVHSSNMEKIDLRLRGPFLSGYKLGEQVQADNAGSQDDPDAQTSASLADNSGGTPTTTIKAISGSGADTDINDNFASISAQVNALVADIEEIRTALVGAIDYIDSLKTSVNTLLGKLRKTDGCGILADNP